MIKMSNKAIGIISGTSAVLVGGSAVTASLLLKDETGTVINNNPLNRDKTYYRYSIANKILDNENLDELISIKKDLGNLIYIIEETKFIKTMKLIVTDILKNTSTFSRNYLNYAIKCNYKISTKSILVDLVWYQPNANNKFFDQFEIILKTN